MTQQDWADIRTRFTTGNGAKAAATDEDQISVAMANYRKRHRKCKRECYVTDIDQIEWRRIDLKMTPVAILELTERVTAQNFLIPPGQRYLQNIADRMYRRDGQGWFATRVAEALNCPAYIVVFQEDMKMFVVHHMTNDDEKQTKSVWHCMTGPQYKVWIEQGMESQWRLANQ
jgi:hypothetical protein